jgi:hypothetical protein
MDDRGRETGSQPVWRTAGEEPEGEREPCSRERESCSRERESCSREREPCSRERESCSRGDHTWVARFLESGRLAYWQCALCGLADREIGPLPERLEALSGWIETPPRLTARGARPPASTRRWTTPRATVLCEGDPSSIHFCGLPIPELAAAHTYVERDEKGEVRATYEPGRERHSPHGDHYTLTRYQVVGDELLRLESYCYEESTFDIPNAGVPRRLVVIAGLTPIQP